MNGTSLEIQCTADDRFDAPVRQRPTLAKTARTKTPRTKAARSVIWLGCATATAIGLSAGLMMIHAQSGGARAEPAAMSAAADWVDVVDPPALFTSSTLPDVSVRRARRWTPDDWRADALESPWRDGPGGSIEIVIAHGAKARPAPRTLFVEAARRAADRALAITRFDQPFLVPTRFGFLEVSRMDVLQSPDTASSAPRPCLGFRLDGTDPHVQLDGMMCAAGRDRPDPMALACSIDGLGLAPDSAADRSDAFLRAFFNLGVREPGAPCPSPAPRTDGRGPRTRVVDALPAPVEVMPVHRRGRAARSRS